VAQFDWFDNVFSWDVLIQAKYIFGIKDGTSKFPIGKFQLEGYVARMSKLSIVKRKEYVCYLEIFVRKPILSCIPYWTQIQLVVHDIRNT
jgi:hypothetical protein